MADRRLVKFEQKHWDRVKEIVKEEVIYGSVPYKLQGVESFDTLERYLNFLYMVAGMRLLYELQEGGDFLFTREYPDSDPETDDL